MKQKQASLDDFLKEEGTVKTASNTVPFENTQGDVLRKLASLSADLNKEAAEGDKPGEGTVAENSDTVAEPSAEVTKQTDNVIEDQVAIDAPGANEEAAKGEIPVTVVGAKPVVSTTGTGGVATPTADLNVEPESAELAKEPIGKTANISDPVVFGKIAARAINDELKKIAKTDEATEAALFLKSAGLLVGYDIAGLTKTASASSEDIAALAFEKMAAKLPLTNDEIICTAQVYGDALEKEAEAERAVELEKIASDEKMYEDKKAIEKLSGDKEVMAAVALLQSKNLLPSA